jgi:hypothetical protein
VLGEIGRILQATYRSSFAPKILGDSVLIDTWVLLQE